MNTTEIKRSSMSKEEIKSALELAKQRLQCSPEGPFSLCFEIHRALKEQEHYEDQPFSLRCDCIRVYIPEFTPEFLADKTAVDPFDYWWGSEDKKSRLEALDKLIEIYS